MLTGYIDALDRGGMHGWVRDTAHPEAPVSVIVTANGRLLGRTVGNVFRDDLLAASIGNGAFGFEFSFSPPLAPSRSWLIHVRSEADGQEMPGSPVRLPAAREFDDKAQRAFTALLDGSASEAELDERIAFLSAERERLLQKRADDRSALRQRIKPSWQRQALPRRALVVDQFVPEPDRDGGSNAIVSHIHSLQRLGYQVTFAAQSMAGGPAVAPLERAGVLYCGQPYYNSVEEVLRREADSFDLVYLHRVVVASAYVALVRQTQRRARLLYSVADLHHLRLARQAEFFDQPELLDEAARVSGLEFGTARMTDAVITHSTVEAALLRRGLPEGMVYVVPWSMRLRPRRKPFADRSGMVLLGNFAHGPNQAATLVLRDEIMPLVRHAIPSFECRLVGDDLPSHLRKPSPGMLYTGHTQALDDVLDTARLTIAPIPFGAGLKGKVLASLSAGLPCICSPTAAEGFDLPPRLQDLVVSDAQSAARAVLRLHGDEVYNDRLSKRCSAFAARAFSEQAVDFAMSHALGN